MSHLFARAALPAALALLALIPGAADAATAAARSWQDGASACKQAPTTKAFSRIDGDLADYSLAPGGDFEAGSAAWTLSGGAKLVSGNESLAVSAGKRSLSLPLGGVATSPKFCIDETNPHFRFAFKVNSPAAGFLARITYETRAGLKTTKLLSSKELRFFPGTWSASPLSPLATLLPLDGGQTASVQIQLLGANFTGTTSIIGTLSGGVLTLPTSTIDSVMVDPYRRS